jgi:ADP-ribose pyrophosphatase YjhB (NUDIX family)
MRDSDFFTTTNKESLENNKIERTAVRAVLYNSQNQIALVGNTYVVLPGGGMEAGENYEQAVRREVLEEVGCEIRIISELGKTIEYRDKAGGIQESYCFIAKVQKDGIPTTAQYDEIGMKITWCFIDEALDVLDKQFKLLSPDNYHAYFNIEISKTFLKEVKKLK